uniref:Uncharacterized protein n=1 Tax=Anguilla anguilla TaxID=7936 RepID=A0A0E9W1M7_ANGAN
MSWHIVMETRSLTYKHKLPWSSPHISEKGRKIYI